MFIAQHTAGTPHKPAFASYCSIEWDLQCEVSDHIYIMNKQYKCKILGEKYEGLDAY